MEAELQHFALLMEDLEENDKRNNVRLINRSLRDESDPFSLTNTAFRKIFRLPKDAAMELIDSVVPHLQSQVRDTCVPGYLKVLTALQYYGQGSYQAAVGRDYNLGLSQPSVSRAVRQVTTVINEHLLQVHIKFPIQMEDLVEVKRRFLEKFGFPGVVGVIDCTHVSIVAPPIEDDVFPGLVFLNRKGYYSLNVQIVCDANLKIMAINARHPGSVHDAAIWLTSNVKQHFEDLYQNGAPCGWLLGDSGYPNEPWLLTEVLNAAQDSPEERYNTCLRSVRNTVERCNGVLKQRFRCLLKHRVLHYRPDVAGCIINACAVLHNMMVVRNMQELDEDDGFEDDHDDDDNHVGAEQGGARAVLNEGRRVQERVIRQHFT